MPFNPGQYVFQPRPLQNFDFGQGSRDVIQARQGKRRLDQADAQLGEQQAGRRDLNTRFSAELAGSRNDAEYESSMKRHQAAVGLVDAARKAVASGDWNTADALMGRIAETGGRVNKTMGPNGRPIYDFNAPEAPGRQPLDVQGMRRDIFGSGGPQMSAPFSMPGLGPNASKNPFESLPGASAAQLPQSSQNTSAGPPPAPADAAGPPPGAAIDGPRTAPPGAVWLPPEPPMEQPPAAPPADPQTAQPGSPQLTGPNPMGTSAFSPYRLDTNQLISQNQMRLDPFLKGFQRGVPPEYQGRLNGFNASVSGLALNPDDALKLASPYAGMLTGLMRSDINAENAAASLGLRGQSMQNSRNDRLMRNAQTRTDVIGKKYQLPENITRWQSIADVRELLSMRTGQADTQAISMLRNLHQSGVMTDKDFENVKSGAVRTWWQAIKDNTIEKLVANGVNPDARAALMQIIEAAQTSSVRKIRTAQQQMLATVRNPRTNSAEERDYYINSIAQSIPESLWDPMIAESMGIALDQKSGPMDQSGNFPTTPAGGGESIGTAPLPRTLDGGGTTSVTAKASASRKEPVKRYGPGKKSKDELTEADMDALSTQELEELLSEVP